MLLAITFVKYAKGTLLGMAHTVAHQEIEGELELERSVRG